MIQIISGQYRGRKLLVPEGKQLRPTANRVRESIFNVLQHLLYFEDRVVLDLYAGSGALGLEAISRGCGSAYFVESNLATVQLIKQNLQRCGAHSDSVHVIHRPAETWLSQFENLGHPCLVFVDPPYYQDEYAKILPLISKLDSIPETSVIVVESPKKLDISAVPLLEILKEKQYGETKVIFLEKKSSTLSSNGL